MLAKSRWNLLLVRISWCNSVLWQQFGQPWATYVLRYHSELYGNLMECYCLFIASTLVNCSWPIFLFSAGLWLASTVGFKFIPTIYRSSKFNVPLKPFIPSLGVLSTIHLMLSLGWPSHLRFIVGQVVAIIIYFAYTIHNSPDYSREIPPLLGDEVHSPLIESGVDGDRIAEDDKKLF